MDGNFSIAPRLYVIRAGLSRHNVRHSLCLCVERHRTNTSNYTACSLRRLPATMPACYDQHPDFVMTDFEQAVVSATKAEHVEHRGCFYHLTQATWRKV